MINKIKKAPSSIIIMTQLFSKLYIKLKFSGVDRATLENQPDPRN